MSTDVNVPAGIPWRFDLENVPEGLKVIVWVKDYACLGIVHQDRFYDDDESMVPASDISAWCLVTTPIPPLTTQEDHK